MNLPAANYNHILSDLKEKIKNARLKAVLTANAQLLTIYQEIGKVIAEQEKAEGWGAKTVERLSIDLKTEFEEMKGLSPRNLRYMRDFYLAYPHLNILQQDVAKMQIAENESYVILQQAVAKLPWGHHIVILTKVKTFEERTFYIQKVIENNWSREILSVQIEGGLYKRIGASINNFNNTLPALHSDLAVATIKNPYLFDFLAMGEKMQERELEKALISHLKKFMLELGKGFAYVGNQYNLNVDGDEFFLDLLFYNTHLHCYVIFELKIGEFKPEFAGKLNFYINTVDAQIKGKEDKPTLGVLLCKTPNETVVKFALQGIQTPMGVSEYKLADALPKQLKSEMPTIEELEKEIDEEVEQLKSQADKSIDHIKNLVAKLGEQEEPIEGTPEKIRDLLEKVIFIVDDRIQAKLRDIIVLFNKPEVAYWTSNRGFKSREEIRQELLKDHIPTTIYLDYRLDGFKKAGTKIFGCVAQLHFSFQTYKYCCGPEQFNNYLWEKLYHQLPTEKEITDTADYITIKISNQIEESLKRNGLV